MLIRRRETAWRSFLFLLVLVTASSSAVASRAAFVTTKATTSILKPAFSTTKSISTPIVTEIKTKNVNKLYATPVETDEEKESTSTATSNSAAVTVGGDGLDSKSSHDLSTTETTSTSSTSASTKQKQELPWWWDLIWKLDVMKTGTPGEDIVFGDTANVLRTNIEQIYGGAPSKDGCPIAEGELNRATDGTMFLGLQDYNNRYGSPYKLCFGPKSFLVVSDPVQARHILRDANVQYDKGVLAEILEPIMGKGLIPADPQTWNVRRRQVVPAFHKAWLEHMVGLFAHCNQPLIDKLNHDIQNNNGQCEMEAYFCSVALDIIGLSVFNYDFGSVTKESPVIKAVYSTLVEAEHRSRTPAPYWDLPLANQLVPRLRKFNRDLALLNDILDDLIQRAKNSRVVEDIEELEKRNYDQVQDPSLLRFLVDMRGADIDNKQLRDDLMTMLIAGHETTAAVLTWALYELVRHPDCMAKVREEIDRVVGDRHPTFADMKELEYLRLVIAETLRLYPEPPLLIRRCRTQDDNVPAGGGRKATVIRGMDLFLAIYNLHRDERFWPEPEKFDPLRFTRPYTNPDIPEWKGFDPDKWAGKLYPTETAADFAFLPFGGGARKCIGDDFALMEATVTLAMVLRRFDFEFDPTYPQTKHQDGAANHQQGQTLSYQDFVREPWNQDHPVGMRTGATIHTRNGLHMIVKKRTIAP